MVLPEIDEVDKYDLSPKYILMYKTSDVLISRWYVYVLFSLKDRRLYIGLTNNLKRRLLEHARGGVNSTKTRRPLKLIHYQYFINEDEAKKKEVFLKSGFGRGELKKALRLTLDRLEYRNLKK